MIIRPLNNKIMNNPNVNKTKKYLGQVYSQAYNHVSQFLNSLPKSDTEGLIEDCEVQNAKNGKLPAQRKNTVSNLMSRLEDIQGKKTSHQDRILKKKLKNQMKKKKMKEELLKKRSERTNAQEKDMSKDELESGSLQFNKINFNDEEKDKKKKRFKKERPRVERDPAVALKRIEGLNEKVSKLNEAGEKEKAEEILTKDKWKCALLKAEGLKVKDNATLLKKSMKKRDNEKKKSTEKWKERNEFTKKKREDAQKKRKENILKKKKEKKNNKIKKSIKKGRVVL